LLNDLPPIAPPERALELIDEAQAMRGVAPGIGALA